MSKWKENTQSAEQPNRFKNKKVCGAGHYINYLCVVVMETVKTGRKCKEFVAVQFRSCIQTMLFNTSIEPHTGIVNIILSVVLSASF